ncbi:MAG: type II toxin-antitoxin system RelE/ParE family toxin [Gammaproteobacteria bacterium]|nr:type II toxin-antitoxin system RelE/ParE family toxin [Gammaproteobacteria bacterium]MDP2140762.1 type II toxin-antitoxin system RelE/ParE family toxin [Gammaproteobacteria bacterium]MDP2347016.1 type II toxin-antitoxin system RelE/ParE family toxin [Gammaproteobacteria bacterium]
MQTVVELPEYLREADAVLGDKERSAIIEMLARNPTAGILMAGTGGIRKIRWARSGGGKSGGVRVIYYFYNFSMPLFLLTLFAKNDKSNLSRTERNELAQLVLTLRSRYTGTQS